MASADEVAADPHAELWGAARTLAGQLHREHRDLLDDRPSDLRPGELPATIWDILEDIVILVGRHAGIFHAEGRLTYLIAAGRIAFGILDRGRLWRESTPPVSDVFKAAILSMIAAETTVDQREAAEKVRETALESLAELLREGLTPEQIARTYGLFPCEGVPPTHRLGQCVIDGLLPAPTKIRTITPVFDRHEIASAIALVTAMAEVVEESRSGVIGRRDVRREYIYADATTRPADQPTEIPPGG